MNLQIDEPIYRWLFTLNLLPTQVRKLKNGKVEIPLTNTTQLETGTLILKLIQTINTQQSLNQKLPSLSALKLHATAGDKLYNWSLLADILKGFGFILNEEMKRLIISGNTAILNDILKELFDFFNGRNPKINKKNPKVEASALINSSVSKSLITNQSIIMDKNMIVSPKECIDLANIDIQKPLELTESLLEFLVVGVSRNLNLKANQTIALFTKNTKYLAHVISKGVKGDFYPIIAFLNEILEHLDILILHLQTEETQTYLISFLQIIKPSLVSKSIDIAKKGLHIYSSLSQALFLKKRLTSAWDWLIGPPITNNRTSGLHTTLLCMKRHPDLTHEIAGFLIEIGKGNYLELFTSQLRNKINDERQFLYIIARLFESLTESLGETLVESGILEKWIENALEPANNLSESTLSALNFLTEVLLQYPQSLDHESAINLINSFKKAGKESFGNAFCIIISLFRLLESFGRNKDPLAPIIYKTLTFILIENTNSMEIRGLIMGNMMQIIEDLESIPLSIIIEPWVKHIQVSNNNNNNENNEEYHWNTIDFEFLRFLAIKDKLLIKNAIQILDLLAKTMLNDHIFAIIALETMMILIYKFITNETLMEFLSKLIKIALAIYFAAEKKRKSKIKGKQIIVSKPNPSPNELSDKDLDTIAAQKNAIIVKFLKNLAEIKNEGLNDRLKPLVAHTNLQLKKTLNTKNSDKGMMEILSLWGNAEKLSTKYENEYYESLTKEKLKKREEELRSQMKSGLGLDTTGNISRISATSNREIIDQNLNNTSFDQKQERHLQDGNSTVELANANTNFENGLRSKGIGYKSYFQKSTLSKDEQMKMALLRNPKADPKILNQLKELAQTYKDHNQSVYDVNETQKSVLEKQKVTLRKQLEKRSIEQGIASKNMKDIETNLIFPLNSREIEVTGEKKHGLFEIEVLQMLKEEERDFRFVDGFFRKYNKVLKYFFVKYANLSVRKTRPDTFEKMTTLLQRITIAELWKLLRDYNYFSYISQDKVDSMVRLINIHVFKEKDDHLKSLSYEGFQSFLLNLAYLVYSKDPPGDLRHLPPNFALEEVIKHFRGEELKKGNSTLLYDDPEATVVVDASVLKEFNRKLAEDHDYVLPDGFKKISDSHVKFDYKLIDTLKASIPEEYQVCYEVLNDVFNEKLGFWLYEPLSIVTQVYIARPKIMNPVSSKVFTLEKNNNNSMINSSSNMISKAPLPLNKSFTIQPRKKVLEIAHKQPLSFQMKLEIANFDPRYRYMAEEVGYLLESLLSGVEKGLTEIPAYQKIINSVIVGKTRNKSIEEEIKEKKEEKRKIRHHLIKQTLKENGVLPENELKRKELMKKREEELIKAKAKEKEKEEEKKKKNEEWDKRIKKHGEVKKKLGENHKKKLEEEVKKNNDDEKKKENEKNEKKKQFIEFNKKTKEKLKNKFEEVTKARKQSQENKSKAPELEQAKIKSFNEKILPKILEKTADQIKKDKEFNDLLKEKLSSEEFQLYFQKQESTYRSLFAYLVNITQTPLNMLGRETIPLKTLLNFANEFEICPLLTNFTEIITSYNNMIKSKQMTDTGPIGVNYHEFIEILFRIAGRSHHILNKISEYMKISGSLNEEEKAKINKGNETDLQNPESIQGEASHINKLTLNGLLFYLGLPIDPLKKEEVNICFRRKTERKEIKTNKKKKLDLQRKLDGEGYENSPLLGMKEKKKKPLKTSIIERKEEVIEENKEELMNIIQEETEEK